MFLPTNKHWYSGMVNYIVTDRTYKGSADFSLSSGPTNYYGRLFFVSNSADDFSWFTRTGPNFSRQLKNICHTLFCHTLLNLNELKNNLDRDKHAVIFELYLPREDLSWTWYHLTIPEDTQNLRYKHPLQSTLLYTCYTYSITSMARTRMARLPWMIRTLFSVPTKFFQ